MVRFSWKDRCAGQLSASAPGFPFTARQPIASSSEPAGPLKAMDPGKLLSIYMGWRARIIHSHRRKVNISKELLANPVLTSRQRNFAIFRAKIENGDQLWPHLSRKI